MLFRSAARLGLVRFFADEGEEEQDGGGSTTTTKTRSRAPGSVVDRLINRFGGAEAALGVVAGENFSYRKSIRDLEAKLATVGAKAPKDGQLVLSREQAADWEAYQKLGKPSEVAEVVAKKEALESEVAEVRHQAMLDEALEAAGLRNKTVLGEVLKARGLVLEMKDETVEGKTVKVPFVRPAAEENGASEKLLDYIDSKAADYKVVLTGAAPSTNGGGVPRRFPATTGGDSKPQLPGDKVTERLERRLAATSAKSQTT